MNKTTKLRLGLVIGVLASVLTLPAHAGYAKRELPNTSDSNNLQPFFCTATVTREGANPTVTLNSHAQLISGFLNKDDPDNTGSLRIPAQELNKYYFNAFQDPDMLKEQGYVEGLVIGADLTCELGTGDGREPFQGPFGKTHKAKK